MEPIRKLRPLEDHDHVALEKLFSLILSICVEAKALHTYHELCNPIIVGNIIDKFPLNEIRDWDLYKNREGALYPNEFRALEAFCSSRISGVRRLAERQKFRASHGDHQKGDDGNGKKDFHKNRHDKKGKELYRVTSAAANGKN